MELSDSRGVGWDGRYMLYRLTIDGWNDNINYQDVETLATIKMEMDPDTAERQFFINLHHEKSETNIHLMRLVDAAIDVLLHDSKVDLDEDVRKNDPILEQLEFDFDEEEE